jgi:hypothetical protein
MLAVSNNVIVLFRFDFMIFHHLAFYKILSYYYTAFYAKNLV